MENLKGVQKVNNFGIVRERFNTLSWQLNSGATEYEIYRDGILIAMLGGSVSSYEDHDQPSYNQTYAVVAVNGEGASIPVTVIVGK